MFSLTYISRFGDESVKRKSPAAEGAEERRLVTLAIVNEDEVVGTFRHETSEVEVNVVARVSVCGSWKMRKMRKMNCVRF